MRIAIDIGGVLCPKDIDGFMPGAIEAIIELAKKHELWILSFCGKTRELESRTFLLANNVNIIIPENNWIFVKKPTLKANKMKELNLDILIDDTQCVIDSCTLKGVKTIKFIDSWKDVLLIINEF